MRTTFLAALPLLSAAVVAVVVAVAVLRGGRRRRIRRVTAIRADVRRDLLAVVLGREDDSEARRRLQDVARRKSGRHLLRDLATSVAGTVRGEADGRLSELAAAVGIEAELLEQLRDPDQNRRAAAAETIGALRLPMAVEALHIAMRDDAADVRVAAATAYIRLDAHRAAPALLRMLGTEEERAAERLADLVSLLGPAAAPAVLEQIGAGERTPRMLRVLVACGDPMIAQPVMVEALAAPDSRVRVEAARGLTRGATTLAVPGLLAALGDPDEEVRAHAATALGQIGVPQVVPALVGLLDDPQWSVRQRAAAAVAAVPGGVTVLTDLIGRSPQFVTTAAATGLQQAFVGTGLLTDLIADDPARRGVAEAAVAALVQRGQMTALLTEAAARYPHPGVRERLGALLAVPVPQQRDHRQPAVTRDRADAR
ncbi:HEAT repeat protein [Blastococcus colisei]|uniref:HEAT repeat protein n=1 Tax=Blastococcus colisei TaxID=1564162 RepID=A0A543PJL8_9ACTN|nr:HEAT repeat domain-containing protein [Blastococcus colisei]TQN44272.1 HEAT repeat protein [Blastococcus colisei]